MMDELHILLIPPFDLGTCTFTVKPFHTTDISESVLYKGVFYIKECLLYMLLFVHTYSLNVVITSNIY